MRIKKIIRAVTGFAGSYDYDAHYVVCFSGFYLKGIIRRKELRIWE